MAESIPIETLKITVTSSGAGQVRKNLEEVAAGLKAVRDSVKGGTDQVGNIVERLKLLISAISDLDGDKVDKLARLGDALSKLKAGTVGSSSEAVFNKIANGIKTISDAAKDIKNLEPLERLADVLERLKAVGFIKMGISGTKSVAKAAKEAEDAGIGTGDGGAGGEADQLDPEKLKQLKKDLKEADSILAGLKAKYFGWIKAIGRVAIYRAIRSLIKSIMQSLNDGLEHFYQYSLKVNGLYATARAEIKTSMHYVSDALGAAAGQLIEKIYPVVVKILDATAEIFNNISEMIAHLSGEETYTRAVRGVADINAEAKKLKATILGFDEINKLNGNNGSGTDETGHFEEAKVNKMRASVTAGIMSGLGALVAGAGIADITADVIKLTNALGVKGGLAGAAQEATNALGSAGSGGSGGSGLFGVLGKFAAGVGTVVALKFTDVSFENYLSAEEGDEKMVAGIQSIIGAFGTVALAGMAGGAAGVAIAIPALVTIAIQDVLVNKEAREKVDNALSEFNQWMTKTVTGKDVEGGGRGITSKFITSGLYRGLAAYIPGVRDVLAGEVRDLTGQTNTGATKLYRGEDGKWYTLGGDLWDSTNGVNVTNNSGTNVTVELDGEVLARVVAGAGNRIDRRGGNYDELR